MIDHRLVVYGTLAPGEVNADKLEGLVGSWSEGTVRGHLTEAGWGAHLGFPGLVPDPNGPAVRVKIFYSPDLPDHWGRLDAFEGEAYRRLPICVESDKGPLEAWIYTVAPPAT